MYKYTGLDDLTWGKSEEMAVEMLAELATSMMKEGTNNVMSHVTPYSIDNPPTNVSNLAHEPNPLPIIEFFV